MAEIASAGRTGPFSPASVIRAIHPDHLMWGIAAPSCCTAAAAHAPRERARPNAAARHHPRDTARFFPASSPLHSRDTGCKPRATPAQAIRNTYCYIRASTPLDPSRILRYILRSVAALPALCPRVPCGTVAHLSRPLRALPALTQKQHIALPTRRCRAGIASGLRMDCGGSSQHRASLMRQTRAIVVAYRRECDAILAPMNPPLLPHTRATHSPLARLTGATAHRSGLRQGGQP
jgi:hypothetical protein